METEAEALARINQPFHDLEYYTHAIVQGYVRGLLVVGDPGLGKSFGVEKVIDEYRQLDTSGVERFEVIKGVISTPFIYRKMYEFRHQGMVLIFDDCEIEDVDGYNLLKAALDSGDKREISWYKESAFLKREKLPSKFEFKGGVIQLTNADLMNGRGKKQDHLNAIISRCHYIDMRIPEPIDKVRRIKYVVYHGGMLKQFDLSDKEVDEIISYIEDGADDMRELSLRMAKKVADLYIAFPDSWRGLADRGCKLKPDERAAKEKLDKKKTAG